MSVEAFILDNPALRERLMTTEGCQAVSRVLSEQVRNDLNFARGQFGLPFELSPNDKPYDEFICLKNVIPALWGRDELFALLMRMGANVIAYEKNNLTLAPQIQRVPMDLVVELLPVEVDTQGQALHVTIRQRYHLLP